MGELLRDWLQDMAAPTIVRIEVRHASGLRRGSGCVVPGGYVLTAARLVAPRGPTDEGAVTIAVMFGASPTPARRVALPDYWTSARTPEADLALLEADWSADPPEAFETPSEWSFVGEQKVALIRGYDAKAGLWHERGLLTHVRSEVGLDAYQTSHLRPPPESTGGPITPVSRPSCLVGIVTQVPVESGSRQLGVPVATVTYEALRQKLDLLRARSEQHRNTPG